MMETTIVMKSLKPTKSYVIEKLVSISGQRPRKQTINMYFTFMIKNGDQAV